MVDVADVEQSDVGESTTRRPFLTEAGEGLLDLIDPLERMRRNEQFILDTGLDARDVVDSAVVTVPLPLMWLPSISDGGESPLNVQPPDLAIVVNDEVFVL